MRKFLLLPAFIGVLLLTDVRAADTVVPPENIVTQDIPPIPASIAESVGRYTEFRAAGFRSWHPTRREMLIRTRFADTAQIHLVKMPLGARTQLTFFADSVNGGSFQPTAGDYFLFSKDAGGNEFAQLYRYDLATGDITLLTDGKSRNSAGVWSSKGDRIVYTSTRRNRKDADFYVMSLTDPKAEKLLSQMASTGWGALDWSPDDRTILIDNYISINESHLYLVDAATGERSPLTSTDGKEKVAWAGGVFAKDGKGVFTATDQGSEFSRLAYIDIATKAVTILTPDLKWDVESFALSDDGKHLAYVTNEDGAAALHLMDVQTKKDLPLPRLPAGQISSLDWHKNNMLLAFTLTSARAPADVYSLDITTSTIERWTQSETAGLNTAAFSEPELIRWKSFDGQEISGFLYAPDPAKFPGPRRVIINIHGGPESQFRPGFFGGINYYLNVLGVAIIFPNVRGSAGYGKTFLTLDNGKLREDSVKDIGALLDWVKTSPTLDAGRVMITGGSYGGYMTLACSVHFADRIRCSVDVVGISNFVTFLQHTEPYRQDLRRAEYGDERDPDMREFLSRISPLTSVAKITKPILIVQGANDPRVPRTEADQMVAALKKQGTPVWYLLAKDEGHGFAKKKNADYQFYATVAFVKEHLLPPSPGARADGAPAPVPADEVMSAAGRRPHPAPKAGEVVELTPKTLGNFEYDQDKGGNIPDDIKRLSGARIRVRGWMIPMDQAANIRQFAIVPKLVGGSYLHMPLVQHTIVADCPKGKAMDYYPDELIVEGVLKVEERKEDGFIIGVFYLDVTSVKAAAKQDRG